MSRAHGSPTTAGEREASRRENQNIINGSTYGGCADVSFQDNILYGIDAELKESRRAERFRIEGRQQDGSVWKVWLTPGESGGRLDESLEGAVAWWPGDQRGIGKGTADVLSVVPEEELVVLRFLTSPLPEPGKELRIYPIQYLQKLRDLWANDSFATARLQWWDCFAQENSQSGAAVNPSSFPWLRTRQREAFHLPAWRTSFLWGPPGTGKTTTLGALLARMLQQHSTHRILLLSTTNSAVDQAIVAVDIALAELTGKEPQPSALRRNCLRIGTHFVPRYYESRQHLLPTKDLGLLKRLMELHKNEPPRQQAQQYARWKAEIEAIQNEIRKQAVDALKRARLGRRPERRSATTTCRSFLATISWCSMRRVKCPSSMRSRSQDSGNTYCLLVIPGNSPRSCSRKMQTRKSGLESHHSSECPRTTAALVSWTSSREWLQPSVISLATPFTGASSRSPRTRRVTQSGARNEKPFTCRVKESGTPT